MKVSLTLVSGNAKIGPIPSSMTSAESCPPSCPFKGKGCYADTGPIQIHWKRLTNGLSGMDWPSFCKSVRKCIQAGVLWRHNTAGDLPGEGENIDGTMLRELIAANRGRKGFTYSHKHTTEANLKLIKESNDNGFTVNLSANNPDHADRLAETGAGPVVTVLPARRSENDPKTLATPQGRKIIICPATYKAGVNCMTCRLCQRADRSVIVGFEAHGTRFNAASKIAGATEDTPGKTWTHRATVPLPRLEAISA
jgi:hypothetical protein